MHCHCRQTHSGDLDCGAVSSAPEFGLAGASHSPAQTAIQTQACRPHEQARTVHSWAEIGVVCGRTRAPPPAPPSGILSPPQTGPSPEATRGQSAGDGAQRRSRLCVVAGVAIDSRDKQGPEQHFRNATCRECAWRRRICGERGDMVATVPLPAAAKRCAPRLPTAAAAGHADPLHIGTATPAHSRNTA